MAFLKSRVKGPLKLHHEFRVSVAECPNACSRPQIVDVGLIGARRPRVAAPETCSGCGACEEACEEAAVTLHEESGPSLRYERCLSCGKCIEVCPTGTIVEETRGFRILVGGKLGRHPQLGVELPGTHGEMAIEKLLSLCLDHYQEHCTRGERLGEIINRTGLSRFIREIKNDR